MKERRNGSGRLRRGLVAAAAVGAFAAAVAGPAPPVQDRLAEATQMVQSNDLRQKRVELANGSAFYLVLDPDAGRLQMLLKGAVLRDFKLLGIEAGFPEVLFLVHRPDEEWQGRIFTKGDLDPPREQDRFVMVAPPPSPDEKEPPPVPIPPTPEEKYPVPSRYHVRFAEGLSIEIRTGEADPQVTFWRRLWNGVQHWWSDARSALGGAPNDAIRLRLVLKPEDAQSLYRALPPATKLLVLPKA